MSIFRWRVKASISDRFPMFHGVLPCIPVQDQSYDTVIASQALEHIIRRNTFTSEISRIMKPEGQPFIFFRNDRRGLIDGLKYIIKHNRKTFEAFFKRHFDEVLKDIYVAMAILHGHMPKPAQKEIRP